MRRDFFLFCKKVVFLIEFCIEKYTESKTQIPHSRKFCIMSLKSKIKFQLSKIGFVAALLYAYVSFLVWIIEISGYLFSGKTPYTSSILESIGKSFNPLMILAVMLFAFPFSIMMLLTLLIFFGLQKAHQKCSVMASYADVLLIFALIASTAIFSFILSYGVEEFLLAVSKWRSNEFDSLVGVTLAANVLFFSWFVPLWNRYIRDWFFGNKTTLF